MARAVKSTFQVERYPKMRRLAPDIGWLTRSRYTMRGMLEVDVTLPRQRIREHQARTGECLSFTAFLTACVGQAVDADKQIHAMRNWKGDLVIFDDVDISVLIEREKDGLKYPLAHIVRAANRKTLLDIHNEIREVQARPVSDREASALETIVSMPRPIRRLALWVVSKSPQLRKETLGTVTLSAVGMFGNKAGWAMAPAFHTLALIVGGIAEKPGVVNGRIEAREVLALTVDFDHEVIDGAPAARFAKRLVDLIESGYSLGEYQ
jgi:pyruvate/2-oxoglutarate dehydrogenase complex dihydrolipoamide acyltransferase (E2) component